MSNSEKYLKVFVDTLEIRSEEAEGLKYNSIANWDSVGHMNLVAALEDAFDIMMDTDDIIDSVHLKKARKFLPQTTVLNFKEICYVGF